MGPAMESPHHDIEIARSRSPTSISTSCSTDSSSEGDYKQKHLLVPSIPHEEQSSLMTTGKLKHVLNQQNSQAVTSCIMYSTCSVSMILVNKSLASSYSHLYVGDMNIILVVFQAIVAVLCVELCRSLQLVQYATPSWAIIKSWAPVNIFFCLMLFTGMASLQYNSVPMVTVFKNVTNIVTTAGDFVFFGNKSEPLVLAAFGIMLIGAVLAAHNDIEISMTGIFWMIANCVSTSGYVLYMKHATQSIKLSKFGMVFVNNVLCVAFLLPVAFINGEVAIFTRTPALHTIEYTAKNTFAGFVGFFLNFASLNCVAATGPTTYAIVGSLNKIPVSILGYILFDNQISAQTWFYIGVSMCGGFLYSYAKIQTSRQQKLRVGSTDK